MALLEFEKVKKKFKWNTVLEDISFSVLEGEIFGLVGRSGCGKSTLLSILVGTFRANSGKILFDGKRISKKIRYLRENTGFAPQEDTLFQELTVRENAMFFGKLYKINRKTLKTRFNNLLSLLSLVGVEDKLIKNLSGGMKKRANLLVSLIHGPKLLILDEPTVGLDPILRKSLWEYIRKINDEGTTILITSHLLEEIEENCDRVAMIKDGKVIAAATVEQYKEYYGKDKSLNDIFEEITS